MQSVETFTVSKTLQKILETQFEVGKLKLSFVMSLIANTDTDTEYKEVFTCVWSKNQAMEKRKHGDDSSTPVDIISSDPVYNGYLMSKHRSCWIHVVWSVKASGKKISKREAQNLRGFKLTAKCFLGEIPCRARSKRQMESKNSISKQKTKMDDGAFQCYLENLWRTFPEDKRSAFAYFDCLWFALYRNSSFREKVLSWIKKKQIFSKKYVLVPIVCWSHWSLVIFCHFGESLQSKTKTPCILLLDSLQMANPMRLEPDIRKYVAHLQKLALLLEENSKFPYVQYVFLAARFVFDIYKAEGRPEEKQMIYRIPLLVPKVITIQDVGDVVIILYVGLTFDFFQVPQQRDDKECGNFVLYYLNLFVESAPENFTVEGYPYFMKKDWFNAEGVDRFCETLDSFGM
ncbi:hypothetical protein PTKIN_Ptkin05aG0197000 [Pterospermum kingtungense]